VHVADRPSDEELRAIYGETYFAPSKYADEDTLRAESDRRLNLLRRFVPPGNGRKVLDAGCATGDFIMHAKSLYDMAGVDISEKAIEVARLRNPEFSDRIRAGSLESCDLMNEQFDAICLWDVIEHVWDPITVCRRLLDRLRPGGYLLLSTPAADAPVARALGRFWAFMTPPEHLSFLTSRSARHLFERLLSATVKVCERKGKRANLGFVLYKVRRISPLLMPEAAVRLFRRPRLNRLALYVPTGDVQYVVVQKPPE